VCGGVRGLGGIGLALFVWRIGGVTAFLECSGVAMWLLLLRIEIHYYDFFKSAPSN